MTPERVPLGDVAEFINGAAFKPGDWEESGRRIIRIQNLTDPSKPFNRTNRAVAGKYEVTPGDILVSWSATLGVFVWEGPDTALVNQHIFRVDPDPERVDSDYLRHMLADALIDMERHLHGATMKHVNRREFLATTIPLPPLDEQKRIAAILDAADELRAKRRASLALLDDLLQSTFLDMFGDPVTNPMGWEVRKLGTIAKVLNGYAFKSREYVEDGIRIIRITNVQKGRIQDDNPKYIDVGRREEFSRFMLRGGDILISLTGNVGRVGILQKSMLPAALNQRVGALQITSDDVAPNYLFHILNSDSFEREAIKNSKGVAQLNLSSKWVEAYEIPLPPLDEQKRFTAIVESIEQQKTRYRAHLDELDTLFASLQSRAFKGEL